jgi:hypothetical protein
MILIHHLVVTSVRKKSERVREHQCGNGKH